LYILRRTKDKKLWAPTVKLLCVTTKGIKLIVTNTKTTDNVVIELYNKFSLIAKKIVVLRVFKDKRTFGDWVDADLPQPTLIVENYDGYFIGWAINGQIKTKEQKNFYKDLVLRLKKTFLKRTDLVRVENSSVWALQYALDNGYVETHRKSYEMKTLASFCESLKKIEEEEKKLQNQTTQEELAIYAGTYEKSEDALFDFIRHKAYDYKRINMINKVETELDDLKHYCIEIAKLGYSVIGGKGISTAIAKAKNIAEWTYYNYTAKRKDRRKYKTKKELERLKMSREENIKKIHQLRKEQTKEKIYNAIKELKEKNEKITIRKVAEVAEVNKNTANKYIKQAKDEGII